MGLDMSLYKITFEENYSKREEAIYWRKANAIHNWFVKNCQDNIDNCAIYPFNKNKLELLKNTCEKVLNDNSLAEDLLPTKEGFFFGDTKYNEDYFNDLKYTIDKINQLLEDDNFDYLEYQSSW